MGKFGLTNNQLKLLAMLTMTVDHIGMIFFPEVLLWRVIGRLAFPIYAFMIAEGCRHTRNPGKYLLSLAAVAGVSQIVATAVTGMWMMNVLVTFSLSVLLILLLKNAQSKKNVIAWAAFGLAGAGVYVLGVFVPQMWPDFSMDYGFWGALLPVVVYAARGLPQQLLAAGACLAVMCCDMWQGQWFCLLALPLLALYNGQRGKLRLKWVFYFYYPVHIGLLWLLKMAI